MKRAISLMLLLTLLSCLWLSACGNTEDGGDVTSSLSTTTQSGETTQEVTDDQNSGSDDPNGWETVKDDLPDNLSYADKTFRILARAEAPYCEEFDVFTQTGIILDDAVYARNLALSERFGVTISVQTEPGNYGNHKEYNSLVERSILSGAGSWDIIAAYSYIMNLVIKGEFYNLTDLTYLNMEKPYWNASIVDQFTIDDKLFLISGDISPQLIGQTLVMYENLPLAQDNHIPDLYELVENGQWTHEKLAEFCKTVYLDKNGDQTVDKGDIFGMVCPTNTQVDAFLASYDLPITQKNEAGELVFTFEQAKTFDVYDKLYQLLCQTPQVWAKHDYADDEGTDYLQKFMSNEALFTPNRLYMVTTHLTNMPDEYVILPYPKYDEEQTDYISYAWDQYSLILMPQDLPDPEFAGAMLEALGALSYNLVTPAYYETALKYRYSRNDVSCRMLDIITKNIRIEFAYLANSTAVVYFLRNQINNSTASIASTYKANSRIWPQSIAKYIENYVSH